MFDELTDGATVASSATLGLRLPRYGRARFDMAIPELQWALEIDVHAGAPHT